MVEADPTIEEPLTVIQIGDGLIAFPTRGRTLDQITLGEAMSFPGLSAAILLRRTLASMKEKG